jgi:hypothetical protein
MLPIGYIVTYKDDIEMAITIIICASAVVSIAILSFDSFCKEHPDEAARIFERKDDPQAPKIQGQCIYNSISLCQGK